MSAIGSRLRKDWLELLWGLFAAANGVVMLLVPRYQTVPFHFVWVSLTIVYGLRVWRFRTTVWVLLAVTLTTGAAMTLVVISRHQKLDEAAEVPLMAAMFLAMMWHVGRRQDAIEEVRRLAESEHRLLEREREFVRDASHELRTPITVARGHAELIRASGSNEGVARDAEVVIDELGRMARLSERLLILAASEHPGFLHRTLLSLGPLIVGTVNRWSATASRRWGVEIDGDGRFPADEERLSIALDALVENALRYTGTGDEITFRGGADTGRAVIEVSDTGAGIPPHDLDRIFDRFTRVHRDRDRARGGTGLGLAIVKAIIDAHGGIIEATSAPGVGTTFRIMLPGFTPAPGPVPALT